MAQAAHSAVVERIERQRAQRRTDDEIAFVDVASDEAHLKQLGAQAMCRGFGQRQVGRQIGQAERPAFHREAGQQTQTPLGR